MSVAFRWCAYLVVFGGFTRGIKGGEEQIAVNGCSGAPLVPGSPSFTILIDWTRLPNASRFLALLLLVHASLPSVNHKPATNVALRLFCILFPFLAFNWRLVGCTAHSCSPDSCHTNQANSGSDRRSLASKSNIFICHLYVFPHAVTRSYLGKLVDKVGTACHHLYGRFEWFYWVFVLYCSTLI
jgi:hypothetical protein